MDWLCSDYSDLARSCTPAGDNGSTFCSCNNDGTVLLMQLRPRNSAPDGGLDSLSADVRAAQEKTSSVIFRLQTMKAVKLFNECFSSPVLFRDCVFVGCRDDFLYCLT